MGQKQLPFLPRESIEKIRDRRIRRIVRYASRAVPYYRDLFRREGIDWREIKGAKELDQLPIIDNQLVRRRPELFMAENASSRRALTVMTSGTTGSPMKICHDRRSLYANIAFGERERAVCINICGGLFRPREVYVGIESAIFKQVIAFYEKNVFYPIRPRRRFISMFEPIEKIAAVINTERPDILMGYGGWIDLFFRTAAVRNIDIRPPKMAICIAEALPFGAREYIENKFGVPVFSQYAAAECFKIGFYCEKRSGLHIHEDLCHVRIITADGRSVSEGEKGEVVISNLVNRACVLLNYPIGDIGAFCVDEECGCGRNFQRINELEGRTEDILVLPKGKFLHPRSVWQIIKAEHNILQYRFIQHDLRRFTLDIVIAQEGDFTSIKERVMKKFRGLFGEGALIEINNRADIPRKPGEKFRVVVSKIARSAGEGRVQVSPLFNMKEERSALESRQFYPGSGADVVSH